MKKFSILIFTIIALLTPIFFCNAKPPTSPVLSATLITSTTVNLKASGLSADDDITFIVYDDAYNINLTKSINTGSNTFVTAKFIGLKPGIKYNADAYDYNSDLDTLITFTTTADTSSYTLTYTAGANGSIVGTSPQTVTNGANGTVMTATPNAGYHFTSWSDGSTSATRTDSNVTSNISVTATFAATTSTSTYILTYTAGENGSIVGTSPQTVTNGANGTVMTATPNAGYHFTSWSDGSTSATRTDSNVTSNISVVANFVVTAPNYTLKYIAGENGTIVGTSLQTVNYTKSGTEVTATPNAGYHFTSWSDGVTSATRIESNVVANVSVTANFEITVNFNLVNATSTSANLSIQGLQSATVFNVTLKDKDDSSISPFSLNGTVADDGTGSVSFTGLFPGTSYEATLYYKGNTIIGKFIFTTLPGDSAVITVSFLSTTSVRLDVYNFPPNTDGTLFIKLDDNQLINPSSYVASAIIKSDVNGKISKEFSGLIANTPYIAGAQVPLASGNTYIISSKFTPTAASVPFNLVELNKTVVEATSRIKNNIEGTANGNYTIGSITQLKKVLNERYDDSGQLFSSSPFATQTEIDTFNEKLKNAIIVFEARRINSATVIGGNLTSKGGGLVPDCPIEGCGFNQLMTLINNVITFLLFTVATPLAAIIIAYAGWLYLSSGGNSSDVTKAKKILMNVVIGYVIGLAAWLIVKTIITSLGVDPSINTFLK